MKDSCKKTLRDEIAIAAMQAIIGKNPAQRMYVFEGDEEEVLTARGAYSYADAMLRIRNEGV